MVKSEELKKRHMMTYEEAVKHVLEFDEGLFERFKKQVRVEASLETLIEVRKQLVQSPGINRFSSWLDGKIKELQP